MWISIVSKYAVLTGHIIQVELGRFISPNMFETASEVRFKSKVLADIMHLVNRAKEVGCQWDLNLFSFFTPNFLFKPGLL